MIVVSLNQIKLLQMKARRGIQVSKKFLAFLKQVQWRQTQVMPMMSKSFPTVGN